MVLLIMGTKIINNSDSNSFIVVVVTYNIAGITLSNAFVKFLQPLAEHSKWQTSLAMRQLILIRSTNAVSLAHPLSQESVTTAALAALNWEPHTRIKQL